ncbi:DDE superfamily endonuclease, partial [Rhizoctonia solani AG-3 Rhs1AP]
MPPLIVTPPPTTPTYAWSIIRRFKAHDHYCNRFTRLALERDNAGIENIYNIDQLQAMKLAATAWDSVKPTTIPNCWRHAQLVRTLASDIDIAPADNAMKAKNAVERETQVLHE